MSASPVPLIAESLIALVIFGITHGLIDVREAIMTVLPVEMAAMPNTPRPIHDTLKSRLPDIQALGDDEFYGLASGAYAMVATSAPELYGNVVLTKAAVGH